MAIAYGDDAEADRLARFVAPIGPISGDANLNSANTVLGEQWNSKQGEERESKHVVTYTIPQALLMLRPRRCPLSAARSVPSILCVAHSIGSIHFTKAAMGKRRVP